MGTKLEEKAVENLDDLEESFNDVPESDFDDGEKDESESKEDTPAKEDKPIVTDTKPKDEGKPEWDKERQRADQAEANFRKTQRELEAREAKLTEATTKLEQLQTKLTEYAKANDVNIDEIDPEIVEPKVLKVLKSMKAQIDLANQRTEELEKEKDRFVAIENARQLESDHDKSKSELISDIESEPGFSPKYRNEAIKKADKICEDRGYSPKDRFEAYKLLRKCYTELAEADKPKKETTPKVPVDTGKGGGTGTMEIKKTGSLREIANEYRKKLRT